MLVIIVGLTIGAVVYLATSGHFIFLPILLVLLLGLLPCIVTRTRLNPLGGDQMKRAILAALVAGAVVVGLVAGSAQARPSRAALSSSTVYTFSTGTNKIVAGKNNQGWWSNTVANNNPTNDNYIVGNFGGLLNDYFTFDISAFGNNCALGTSATLTIPQGGHGSGDPFLTLSLHDVSTDPLVLNTPAGTNQPNPAIYNDLGSGKSYGMFTLPGGAFPEATLNLGSVVLQAINQAHANGQQFFSIGGTIPDAASGQYLFAYTGSQNGGDKPVKLTVTVPKICKAT